MQWVTDTQSHFLRFPLIFCNVFLVTLKQHLMIFLNLLLLLLLFCEIEVSDSTNCIIYIRSTIESEHQKLLLQLRQPLCSGQQQIFCLSEGRKSYIQTHTRTPTHTQMCTPPKSSWAVLLVFTSFFVWTLFIVAPSCSPLAPHDTEAALVVSPCVCVYSYHKAFSTHGHALIELTRCSVSDMQRLVFCTHTCVERDEPQQE